MTKLKTEIARKTIGLSDYKARRLDLCHDSIVRYTMMEQFAKTITEKKFCRAMVNMYVKRYNWYLR